MTAEPEEDEQPEESEKPETATDDVESEEGEDLVVRN